MLFTFKLLKDNFNKIMFNQYQPWSRDYKRWEAWAWVATEFANILDKEWYLARNADMMYDYLISIKEQKWSLIELKKLAATDKKALESLFKTIGLDKEVANISEIAEKLESFLRLKWYMWANTLQQRQALGLEVKTDKQNPAPKAKKAPELTPIELRQAVEIEKSAEDRTLLEYNEATDAKNRAKTKQVQEILVKRGHDLWKFGPKKDWVDWDLGREGSLTRKALVAEKAKLSNKKAGLTEAEYARMLSGMQGKIGKDMQDSNNLMDRAKEARGNREWKETNEKAETLKWRFEKSMIINNALESYLNKWWKDAILKHSSPALASIFLKDGFADYLAWEMKKAGKEFTPAMRQNVEKNLPKLLETIKIKVENFERQKIAHNLVEWAVYYWVVWVPLVTFNIPGYQNMHQSITITDWSNFFDAMESGQDFKPAPEWVVQQELNALRTAPKEVREDIVRSYLKHIDLEERIRIVWASFWVFEKWFTDKKYDKAKALVNQYAELVKDPKFDTKKAYDILDNLTSILEAQYKEEQIRKPLTKEQTPKFRWFHTDADALESHRREVEAAKARQPKVSAYEAEQRHLERMNQNVDFMKTFEWRIYQVMELIKMNPELEKQLVKFDKLFNSQTRNKKWAEALVNPNSSFEQEWNALLTLAKNLNNKDLINTLEALKTDDDKKLIISAIVQRVKISRQANEWQVAKLNNPKNLESTIKMLEQRSKWYNSLLMSKESRNKVAQEYYDNLRNAKWKIWATRIPWIGFDASATLISGKSNKWVDRLDGLDIITVDGEPLLTPVDSKWTEEFITRLQKVKWLTKKEKENIANALRSWEYSLQFYMDPQWLDDRVLMVKSWWGFNENMSRIETWAWTLPLFGVSALWAATWFKWGSSGGGGWKGGWSVSSTPWEGVLWGTNTGWIGWPGGTWGGIITGWF